MAIEIYSHRIPDLLNRVNLIGRVVIKATISPKILIGENDYLAAATKDYLEGVEVVF